MTGNRQSATGNGDWVTVNVSVIIPALNEEQRVGRAVASAVAGGAYQTIVADGGSSDRTLEVAAAAGAATVPSQPGRAVQQNAGAASATGDVVLFLHADNWLADGALQQVGQAAAEPSFVAGCLRQRIDAQGTLFRLLEFGNGLRAGFFGVPYGDQCIFVRRTTFAEIGGFPETRLMEDVLLMRRLRKVGWPVQLPGPVYVDARRWQQHGVLRQTFTNWGLAAALNVGVDPDQLARFYSRHDTT